MLYYIVFLTLLSKTRAFATTQFEDPFTSFTTTSYYMNYTSFDHYEYFEDITTTILYEYTINPIDLEKTDHDLEMDNDDDLEKKDYAHFGLIDKLGSKHNEADSKGRRVKNALLILLVLQYTLLKV